MPVFRASTIRLRASGDASRRTLAFNLTALVAIAIAILTLAPLTAPGFLPGTDKIYHLISFATLALPGAVLYPRALGLVLPFTVFFGGAIETIQPVVGRSGEWPDFYADIAGVGLGALLGLCARAMLRISARSPNKT